MKGLIFVIAVCAVAAVGAFPQGTKTTTETVSNNSKVICAHTTICGWSVYGANKHSIDMYIPNDYCLCGPGLSCVITQDNDPGNNYYVHRCRVAEENGS